MADLSGASAELIGAGFGVSAASAVQFGPSVFARNDVGEGDANLGGGQKRTSWASQLGICATFGGNWRERVNTLSKGLVPAKSG